MANLYRRLTLCTDATLLVLASGALFALMLLTFADVFMRSLTSTPIQSATELTRILMAVMVFAALPGLMGRGAAIAIDLLDPLARRLGFARLQRGLIDVFCGVLLLWPARRLWVLVQRTQDHGEVTEFLQVPQSWILSFITVSVAVTALITFVRGVQRLIARPPSDDPSC